MPVDHRLHILGSAYRGDACGWMNRLRHVGRAGAPRSAAIQYNTRRLDAMVAYALEATIEALTHTAMGAAELSELGVVGLSHNGPCLYGENFYRELTSEADPQLVSPTVFAESVLNIVPTHISLALKTQKPAYAFVTDLDHFFGILDTLFLLVRSGQFGRGIFCVSDEFSALNREVFAPCPDFPGRAFVSGAMAVIFASAPASGGAGVFLEAPREAWSPAEWEAGLRGLRASGIRDFILSAYSDPGAGAWSGAVKWEPSFLSGQAMEQEQAFMVTRMAELLDCVSRAEQGRDCALVQAQRDVCQWITVRHQA